MDLLAQADPVGDELICSGRGCRDQAQWGLLWNNPKIHTLERRKVWLACDAHREHLTHFLDLRGFLKDTVPVTDLDRVTDPGSPDPSDR